jgi:multisubunit Na+/H+ antiporter MnhB subunit
MRRSYILDAAVQSVFPLLLVFSIYLLFAGHNQPGGGFAGGLAASAGLMLVFLAGGTEAVHARAPIRGASVLGAGLLLAAIVSTLPLLVGAEFMESFIWEFALPVVGEVKLVSVLFFDTGVYLVVAGMTLQLLQAFGRDEPEVAP